MSLVARTCARSPIDALTFDLTTPTSTAPAMPTRPPAAPPPNVKLLILLAASTFTD